MVTLRCKLLGHKWERSVIYGPMTAYAIVENAECTRCGFVNEDLIHIARNILEQPIAPQIPKEYP